MKLETVIKKCLKDNSKAQYRLYSMLFSRYLNLCLRYRKDRDAAVVSFNNAFLKVLDNLKNLKDISTFHAWVKRILVNQMLTELKKESIERDRQTDIDYVSNHESLSVLNEGSQKLNAEYLMDLLVGLPKMTGIIFNLFAIDGYAHKEISDMLEISVGTSKWHVAEARKRLKLALSAQDETRTKETQKCS